MKLHVLMDLLKEVSSEGEGSGKAGKPIVVLQPDGIPVVVKGVRYVKDLECFLITTAE